MDVLVAFFSGTGLGLIIGVFLFAIAVAAGSCRDEAGIIPETDIEIIEKLEDGRYLVKIKNRN